MHNLPLSLIQYPSGKFGFVGRVPAVLAYVWEDESDLQAAAQCGPGIARKIAERNGRTFSTRVWDTEAEAIAARTAAGF